jgi:hypothetical protein
MGTCCNTNSKTTETECIVPAGKVTGGQQQKG